MIEDASDLPAIERHLAAVTAVHKVVHAIWALSRAQLPLVEAAVEEATQYLDWVDDMVSAVAGAPRRSAGTGMLLILMGPERPYCGPLPRLLLQQLAGGLGGELPLDTGSRCRIVIVGSRLYEMAEIDPRIAPHVVSHLPGATTHEEHEEIARPVAQAVLSHAGGSSVELVYPKGGGAQVHRVTLLAGAREPVAFPPETFSALQTVIHAAVVEALTGRLAVAVAEALRSEVRARIAAADAARRAAEDNQDELRKAWAVARQEQITGELLELVAGTQAATALGRSG